jgi:DNA helicase-2/ATP-dependent DNA helicase PcrA
MTNDLLKNLNPAQKQAVIHDSGPLLIVAGAGTGKTTVLINRLAYLIMEKGVKTDEILLMTFTDKATGEMVERADKILPYGYVDLWINTFHGFCERILRDHALDIGLSPEFKLLNTTEQWILFKNNLDKFNLDYYKPLGNPNKFIHEILRHISRLKDENISPADYLQYAEGLEQNLDRALSGAKVGKKKAKKNIDEPEEISELEVKRLNELANAFHIYNQLLLDNNFLDFGDLINYTLKLFKERPNILQIYQDKFKYVMVDEFQDTNFAQYELVKLLVAGRGNLVVVGDDDQCLPGDSLITMKSGRKRIDKIKVGQEVATAVGRGYLSYQKVNFIHKNKKTCRLVTFTTINGHKIKVTNNHKLFSYLPNKSDKKFYYVYLMNKLEVGWRLGITADIATRLRLEVTADRILAVRSFATEIEARYYETLWSLRYGIPTVCFHERSRIIDKQEWSNRLYKELDVAKGVVKMAQDLDLNLGGHQFSLGAVNRGSKVRIKIIIEMCYRNYRSKNAHGLFLKNPLVSHSLSVETSHQPTLNKLRKLGLKMTKSKLGYRLRMLSADLPYLGKIAAIIHAETGGIIDNQIKVGKTNSTHKKALVVPAKNVLPGMFLPVVSKNKIVYEQILKRTEEDKKTVVYDLEVDRTHNFIANNIVVHNSIYKFRGASISNIMQFKDDYPKTQEVILNNNYRSNQEILDYAYTFIKNNDPNRLETKLKINKMLKSQRKITGQTEPAVKFLNFPNELAEVSFTVNKIKELYNSDSEINWSDFAILVRANDTADKYLKELKRHDLPHQFVSLKGLYYKPIILDIIAYFKLLDNYHESAALFRVLNMDLFKVGHLDLVSINKMARRKVWSLYETLKNISAVPEVSPEAVVNINKLLGYVEKHSGLVKTEKPSRLFIKFLYDTNYLKGLDHDRDQETYSYLNQFYQKIKQFEETAPDLKLKDFMALLNLELEAGESGSLKLDFADADVIKVMTVHGAKGLEFKYVFVVDLVDKRFPTINRGEKISLPDALVKEKIISSGDIHLEEERRLFYVAITRAKDELYLLGAKDCGGVNAKKPSRFIAEMGLDPEANNLAKVESNELERDLESLEENSKTKKKEPIIKYELPDKFSFSQLAAYSTCPLQYRFAFLLKIPVPTEKVNLIFGRIIHDTLREYLLPLIEGNNQLQANLFGNKSADDQTKGLTAKRLLEIYEAHWLVDGWNSKEEREKYYKKGREILNTFAQNLNDNPLPEIMFLEKDFSFKINEFVLKGKIDRVDKLSDGTLEIIDYKTGNPKDKLDWEDKRQLILYQLFLEEFLKVKVNQLSYYYLDNGQKVSFVAKDKDQEKMRQEVIDEINEIKKMNFTPKPSELCKFCDFNGICEFRKI